jgi:peroxiredoxin Q/BCP
MKITVLFFVVFASTLIVNCKNNEAQMKKIEVGDIVPSFNLMDQNGKVFDVNNAIGKPMVIYFYPKDDTPGCTKEACKFRDDFELFSDLETLVIGISADSVESHKKFEQKYNLPLILLADTKNDVRKLFGVPKSLFFILPGRVTYIIDKKGIVKYVFNSQFNAEKHIEIALQKLKKL